jgi:uncharacterized protein YndB with AHSA1/START domain
MTKPLTLTLKGNREVVITREFAAPRRLVFDAHTKPELIRKWLLGMPGWTLTVCEVDLRVGGRFRYVWDGPAGEHMGMGGIYREVAAPARIVSADLFDEDWTGGETINTLEFAEADGRTTLQLTILYGSPASREAALKTGMTEGLEMSYANMDAALAAL